VTRFDLLYESRGLPSFPLPDELAAAWSGTIGFDEPRVFANFVATIDGVVAIPSIPNSNRVVSAGSASDRFAMGLLRACADALVIGSGTMTAAPSSLWTPAQAFPDAASGYAELRRRLGRAERPEVAVLTSSGLVDPAHPVFADGALVLTSDAGAARLEGRLPAQAGLVPLGPEPALDPVAVVACLRERGHRLILTEGGPHVLGSMLEAAVLDELFLTISPLLVGRVDLVPRLTLVEGADLLPEPPAARLLAVRRDEAHLFLRYELKSAP
jgi:riboflavin biosynthesis pyrimidine reductase